MYLKFFTDGGARGNPGPAAIGIVIYDESGKLITKFGKTIGQTTNNVAEYQGVIETLKWIKDNRQKIKERIKDNSELKLEFNLDSKLVASQLNGLFKIKDAKLRQLLLEVRTLEAQLGSQVIYKIIPREKNKEADFEVNKALDES